MYFFKIKWSRSILLLQDSQWMNSLHQNKKNIRFYNRICISNWYRRVCSLSWFFFIANKCLEWKHYFEIYEFIVKWYQSSFQSEIYVFIKWILFIVQPMICKGDSFRILVFDGNGVNVPRNFQQTFKKWKPRCI